MNPSKEEGRKNKSFATIDAMKKFFPAALFALLLTSGVTLFAQSTIMLSNVRRIYIEKMADNLDQYPSPANCTAASQSFSTKKKLTQF